MRTLSLSQGYNRTPLTVFPTCTADLLTMLLLLNSNYVYLHQHPPISSRHPSLSQAELWVENSEIAVSVGLNRTGNISKAMQTQHFNSRVNTVLERAGLASFVPVAKGATYKE